jgi:hypothetical protein
MLLSRQQRRKRERQGERYFTDSEPDTLEEYLGMTEAEAEVLFDSMMRDVPGTSREYESFISWLDPFRKNTEINRKMAFLSDIKRRSIIRSYYE